MPEVRKTIYKRTLPHITLVVVFADRSRRRSRYEFVLKVRICTAPQNIQIADDVRVLKSSISMAVTISIMYVALSGLGEISIIWRPLFSVSLQMLSSLNMFKWTGIPVLLIPHLPPSSPPCLGCGIVILLRLSISWHRIILVYIVCNAFVIFDTAESTFVICG
jgi:hypothetical protein